jgi:hypothetical protein
VAWGVLFVQVGLNGALLAELAINGQLTIADDRTIWAGETRPDDELLSDVYDAVRVHLQGRKAKRVISGLSRHIGGSWNRVVDRLVDDGVLGRVRLSALRPTRHPVLDTATHQAVLNQVRAAAAGEGLVRPDVAVVLALAGPCRLLERVAPDRSMRDTARRQIAKATLKRRSRRAWPRSLTRWSPQWPRPPLPSLQPSRGARHPAASSSATYRHPVHASTANATSSQPENRASQARRCARSAGLTWPRCTCPVLVSR